MRALVQADLGEVNARYSNVSRIKKFALLGHELSHEGGELTPSLKVKRDVVEKKYSEILDALYTPIKE